MKKLNWVLALILIGLATLGCSDDDDANPPVVPNGGTLSGGPFSFIVDGIPDMVSGITLTESTIVGTNKSFVVTDADRNILGLPPTMMALEGVNFDDAGTGVCLIYHIAFETGLQGLAMGMNLSSLNGLFGLSNAITVNRGGLNAGTLSGGPFTFTIDGSPDMVTGIALNESMLTGENRSFVITDGDRNILGLPPTLTALEGVDFDGAGEGVCLIYHLTYGAGLQGLEPGTNLSELIGEHALSNAIEVNRLGLNAGVLSGGPFTFTVDGVPDMVSGIMLNEAGVTGSLRSYVITDDLGNVLGLPPTLMAVEGVDFDGAGVGVCYIYHITYEEGLEGLMAGGNISELEGYFALSNLVSVTRSGLNAGSLLGGPYTFTVDGKPDMVNMISLNETGVTGSIRNYVITDDMGYILGLPPTLEAVKGVDFDGAGEGICFIYHLTYEPGLQGRMVGQNISGFNGNFALSNSVTVNRVGLNAGSLSGGPFTFTVDGNPDMVSGIMLNETGITGSLRSYVITDDLGNILGLPPTLMAVEGVDFDGAGVGVCYIYHITYEEGLEGLMAGSNISELSGFFGLSNLISVTRN